MSRGGRALTARPTTCGARSERDFGVEIGWRGELILRCLLDSGGVLPALALPLPCERQVAGSLELLPLLEVRLVVEGDVRLALRELGSSEGRMVHEATHASSEEHPAVGGAAAVEPEHELIEVGVEVVRLDGALVRPEEPQCDPPVIATRRRGARARSMWVASVVALRLMDLCE